MTADSQDPWICSMSTPMKSADGEPRSKWQGAMIITIMASGHSLLCLFNGRYLLKASRMSSLLTSIKFDFEVYLRGPGQELNALGK